MAQPSKQLLIVIKILTWSKLLCLLFFHAKQAASVKRAANRTIKIIPIDTAIEMYNTVAINSYKMI